MTGFDSGGRVWRSSAGATGEVTGFGRPLAGVIEWVTAFGSGGRQR